ncbi:hypothetical protein [Psychrobacillus antarcticus]|uniref:hypothetical protein n=1 Tax=Psychrobacillus antarcticus TaxID=2879115 RepID=UPI00240853EE|nr:hypothetical protein [Psychrobacillus antarcticus]
MEESYLVVKVRKKYESQESEIKLPLWLSERDKKAIITAIKKDTPILISGKQGPTGKSYLKNMLTRQGAKVFEEWKCQKIVLNEIIISELL